jgi:hypothetical protein
LVIAVAGLCAFFANAARAGDVYLTGHDVVLHNGQNGYDAVILDYLRGATPKASYDIVVVGTANSGFAAFTGGANFTSLSSGSNIPLVGTLAGYGSAKFYDAATLAADPGRAAVLAGADVLMVLSHVNCGGCSLTTAGSNALNSMSADIATSFNAGMDIFGESSANLATYYHFLPPGAAAGGAPIFDSSGFSATPAGTGIGITDGPLSMINGFQTHNNFTSFAPAFTVFETHTSGGASEIISIGLQGGRITDGGIVTGVPDSGTTALLLAMALPALAFLRRKL